MNVFETHEKIVNDYASYVRSFINISDPAISKKVDDELAQGKLWPQPLLQFNPAYEISGNITDIVKDGLFHNTINDIFKGYSLYHHQRKAIELGISGKDFIVTSGTGSGKSLTYIGTIFNHLLTNPQSEGVTAIIVYPMNALINSQTNEFNIFKNNFEKTTGKEFPIIFGQYTGQEDESSRIGMREKPPHILLTNYMMLELLLTRIQERPIRDAIYKNLKFLVFDELHTYRGRQGADVAMLIRRISALCNQEVSFIGTSATMVSGTDSESQKEQVAQVATTLFGRTFSSEQIVDEKLTRSLINLSHAKEDLANAIAAGINIHGTDKELKAHPIAIWLENKIAIEEIDSQLIRRKPQKISDVISALSEDSGLSEEICRNCLEKVLLWISTVNQETMKKGSRYTILPYKLHQFIAQTGSVYTTLDQEEDSRYITLEPGIYKQDDEKKKPIFPNVFSRATGHPFICVSLANNRLEPREFRENSDEELQGTDGYLIIGDNVWDPEDDLDNLPEAWTRMTKNGLVINKNKNDFFPIKLFFDEYGNCSEIEELKYSGWFMKAPLLFDPTGGVFFDTKTNDGTKLTKLGREGRSTSTTITAFSILNQLNEAKYPIKDQKLLSFTDNRQDAALQAGHFNDFIKVIQFRAGIYKALKSSPDNTLSYKNIGEEVFKALNLPFCDFANRNEEPQLAAIRKGYEEVFKKFIFYRAITDLRRSWRIILPNLEQCALLRIDYKDLPEIVTEDEFWSDMPIVSNLNHNDRHEFIANVLDFFRLEYALHSENFLIPSILNENGKEFKEKLKAPWTLDRDEYLKEPNVIRYEPLKKSVKLTSKSMGSASGLGKYIKHYAKQKDLDTSLLKGELYHDFILKLMVKLTDADYLTFSTAPSEKSGEVPVYRLKIDKILWKLGDGETIKVDVIKNRFYKKNQLKPNEYFRDVYSRDFSIIKKLRAEDHTGQLNTDDRKQREERFRAEWYINNNKDFPDEEKIRSQSISALFCSPTMELGIDIGGLSVVHLRNAPPNPANYAQRSGRAGRNGQGALIFTYCSSFSPHDRHFFNNQAELVAGTVQASQIDLKNKELLLTHLNALVISYVGLPGLDSHGGNRPSLMQLVEDDNNKMPLSPAVHEGLQISPTMLSTIKATFKTVIKDFESKLPTDSWYSIDWIDKNIGEIADHLDNSLKRWRSLYSSA
ncbi:MAG: DEAD/DEAH box helicase, partial [bacterium]